MSWLQALRQRRAGRAQHAQTVAAEVNVVGYLQHQLGLGDVGRRLVEILESNGVSVSSFAFDATASPQLDPPYPTDQHLPADTTIAVVAADQLPILKARHPEIFTGGRRVIAYCFWELSTLSTASIEGANLVDEIWVATRFVQDAFTSAVDIPVRRVPIPIECSTPSGRKRNSFKPLANTEDRVVFGVTFDHFSVAERKNPFGAIDAFRAAFEPDDGPLLIVKTINAELVPDQHERLVAHAHGRTDIVIWDEYLTRADQHAFIGHLDVLVSLHRGEGLGLHLAEAMWSSVPVIATGYSGNMDFMDDTTALLVDYSLIDVEQGGNIYPDGAQWAEPDIDQASSFMAQLVADPELNQTIGNAGRLRMENQPTDSAAATQIINLLRA